MYTDKKRKTRKLQELTMKDAFMFGAVLADTEICKDFLEMILGISIDHIQIDTERTMIYNPEYRGVRLDVYVKDENNTVFNVEMQAQKEPQIGRRSRYYQSQMDMVALESGHGYEEIPDSYVIFVCDYDPFGQKKYRYTFKNVCEEENSVQLDDGRKTIILSTKGEDVENVPEEMVKFLKFISSKLERCMDDFGDELIERLQNRMYNIKASREMEGRYMRLELLLHDERRRAREEGREEGRKEGRKEGHEEGRRETLENVVLDILNTKGIVSEQLKARILEETDLELLKTWVRQAITVDSPESFASIIQEGCK